MATTYNIPLFAWLVVATTMLVLIVSRAVILYRATHHRHTYRKHHSKITGTATERELLFVPGDYRPQLNDQCNESDY